MKYYLVDTGKMGTSFNYPDPGHKDYKNCGYSVDKSLCIWMSKDNVDMNANELDNIKEITKEKADDYLNMWKNEREKIQSNISPPEMK